MDAYTAAVLDTPAEIAALPSLIHSRVDHPAVIFEPAFFLASISAHWKPYAIVVKRAGTFAGVVYAKERRIAGVPTGLFFVDGRLGSVLSVEAEDGPAILAEALDALFSRPHVRGVRMTVPPASAETLAIDGVQSQFSLDISHSPAGFHAHARVRLARTYEEFLQAIGPNTRRNFRRYRRRFEALGHRYVPSLTAAELRDATRRLETASHIAVKPGSISRALNVLAAIPSAWSVGLRSANGQWMSVSAGWIEAKRATVFLQLNNDAVYPDASLAVVLRAYLIESMIDKGLDELMFWSGSDTAYTARIPATCFHLDIPSRSWRLTRSTLRAAKRYLPDALAVDLDFICVPGSMVSAAQR